MELFTCIPPILMSICLLLMVATRMNSAIQIAAKFKRDPQLADKKGNADELEFELPAINPIQCVRHCKTMFAATCFGVIYHGGTTTCYGLNTAAPWNISTWSALPGARLYGAKATPPQQISSTSTTTITDTTTTTTTTTTAMGCPSPVPLVTSVADDQLTASSIYPTDNNYAPYFARLDNVTGSWAAENETDQWIQVEFADPMAVTAVITQGSSLYPEWVVTYKLLHSAACNNDFVAVTDPKVFPGNTDTDTHVSHTLDAAVSGRCFRIYPLTYNNYVSLRFELMGCAA